MTQLARPAGTSPTRGAVFIDGMNARCRLEESKWEPFFDPLAMAKKLTGARTLVGVYYYIASPNSDHLSTWHYGYQRSYLAKIESLPKVTVELGYMVRRGTHWGEKMVDVWLATDMVFYAAKDTYDVAILVSADGDLVPGVKRVCELGKKVELIFFPQSNAYVGSLVEACSMQRAARSSYFGPLMPAEPPSN